MLLAEASGFLGRNLLNKLGIKDIISYFSGNVGYNIGFIINTIANQSLIYRLALPSYQKKFGQ